MWKKAFGCSGLLGLIVLLDPAPTPAQPPGGMGGERREFRGFGGQPGGTPGAFPAPGGGPGGFGGRSGMGGPGGGMGGPPGGGMGGDRGAGGRPKFGPDESWAFMQRLTQSTGDTIDTGKIPPQSMGWLKSMNEKSGGLPLPENVVMTKAQFMDHFARSEQAKADFAARGGAATLAVAPSGGMGGPPTGGFGPPGGDRGRMGGPGGGMPDPAEMAAQRVREQDRNNDGKISLDEADGRLRDRFRDIDRNGDGFIDTDEYTGYLRERFGGGPGGVPGGGPGDPNDPYRRGYEKKETEEERPVALRYGKLPKDLPGWYDEFDTDKDGQVSLYEWRKGGKEMKEFIEMDLNGDGLVTADEYLRFARQKNIDTKVAAYVESDGTVRPTNWGVGAPLDGKADGKGGPTRGSGGPPSFGPGKGERPGSDSRPGEGKGEKGERKNPWSKK